jgi:hypothetical protein
MLQLPTDLTMAKVRRQTIPSTAVRGRCPWCGAEPVFVDSVSRRTWHPVPACLQYLDWCTANGTRCLGFFELTNCEQFPSR